MSGTGSESVWHGPESQRPSRAAAGAFDGSDGGRLAGKPFVRPIREPSQVTWFGSYP